MLYRCFQGNQKSDKELNHDKFLSNNAYILGLLSETDHDRLAKMQETICLPRSLQDLSKAIMIMHDFGKTTKRLAKPEKFFFHRSCQAWQAFPSFSQILESLPWSDPLQ